jgi:hypothetical protein
MLASSVTVLSRELMMVVPAAVTWSWPDPKTEVRVCLRCLTSCARGS